MTDIEVPLSVRIDSQGNEFYVAKPTHSQVIDLAKATFLIFHPDEDDQGGALIVKTQGKRPPNRPPIEDVFLKEIARAQKNFTGGYVGLGFFLKNWRPRAKGFPRNPDERKRVLDRLLDAGRIEVYEAEDGKEAIRVTA